MTSTQTNQTTPFAPPKTWEDIFIGIESSKNAKELAGIIADWEGANSSDLLMKAITATLRMALFIEVQGNKDPFLVLSPTIVQGSCFLGGIGNSKPFVLAGLGANSIPFCIDPINIARKVKTGRLPYAELLAATNSTEFSQVEVKDPKTMCQIRNTALVPKFILKDIIRSESRSTIDIALVTINTIRARIDNIQDLSSSDDNNSDSSDSKSDGIKESEEEKQKKQQEKQEEERRT